MSRPDPISQLHRLMDSFSHWRKWEATGNLPDRCQEEYLTHPKLPNNSIRSPDWYVPDDTLWGNIDKDMKDKLSFWIDVYGLKCCALSADKKKAVLADIYELDTSLATFLSSHGAF